MKKKIANLLRALADKFSPELYEEQYIVGIKANQLDFKRICVGYA